jgi:hypothetical protein
MEGTPALVPVRRTSELAVVGRFDVWLDWDAVCMGTLIGAHNSLAPERDQGLRTEFQRSHIDKKNIALFEGGGHDRLIFHW